MQVQRQGLVTGIDTLGKDRMQDRAVGEVKLPCSFMLPSSEPKRLSLYQLLGCQGRARSWMRWTSAAETALLELTALMAVGMVRSSLRGGLSRASLCPSQSPNLRPRGGPLADVITMKQPLRTPSCLPDQGSWMKPLKCLRW